MKRFLYLFLGMVCGFACHAAAYGASAAVSSTQYVPEEVTAPMALEWKCTSLELGYPLPRGGNPSSPILVGDILYFCARGLTPDKGITTSVYAVSAETGEVLWDHPLEGGVFGTPLFLEDRLWIADSKANLYVLDATRQGAEISRFDMKRGSHSTPFFRDGFVYVGTDLGTVLAIDAREMKTVWEVNKAFSVEGAPAASPDGRILYVMTKKPLLHALRRDTGDELWSHPLRGLPTVGPLVWDSPQGTFLYAATTSEILCMNALNGRDRWSVRAIEMGARRAQSFIGAPALVPNPNGEGMCLVVYTSDGGVMVINAANGKAVWRQPVVLPHTPSGSPVVTKNVVFVGTQGGFLYALTASEGKVLWKYRYLPPKDISAQTKNVSIASVPVVRNGKLYVLVDDGTLLCFSPDAVDTDPPVVTDTVPNSLSPIYGRPPVNFSAVIFDEGSGIDQTKTVFKLDGEEKRDAKFDPLTGKITYSTPVTQPSRPLADGRHTASVTAVDWKGNTVVQEWVFEVDNRLIPAPRQPSQGQPGWGGMPGGGAMPGGMSPAMP
ncbi:MAG: PQQ-binding-like beta-propeller repeat protein [Armatimonadota bacterium]|nr:PQQ-binding-like beta-propeller repeat protein [Armatimonadota bacterium]